MRYTFLSRVIYDRLQSARRNYISVCSKFLQFRNEKKCDFAGDGVDYLSLSLRDGRITISINLGNGPLDASIHPDHLRFDDYQWHSVRVHRKVQEVLSFIVYFIQQCDTRITIRCHGN
jgi:hypothetical protein